MTIRTGGHPNSFEEAAAYVSDTFPHLDWDIEEAFEAFIDFHGLRGDDPDLTFTSDDVAVICTMLKLDDEHDTPNETPTFSFRHVTAAMAKLLEQPYAFGITYYGDAR